MDKRIRNTAFVCCALSLLIIMGTVLLLNLRANPNAFSGREKETATPQSEDLISQIEPDRTEFLSDQTFLDEYQPFAGEVRKQNGKPKALLLATSVQGDLRVLVIDENGHLITGESFVLNVKGTGEYKDLDRDGSIYIAGLKAGDYYVALQETEDYLVPESDIKVTVKEQIAYEAIADITYLIKTEAEIRAEEEDTAVRDAMEDMDQSEITALRRDDPNAVLGIDVSKWNGEIDWERVKNAGVNYAIIRLGYRGSKTGALVEDPYFRKNMENAIAAGVEVGVYFFTQAITETEAVEEASMVLSLLEGYELSQPVFIDSESSGGRADGLDVATRTAVCKAFCETVRSMGYQSGVYASRNWFYHKLSVAELNSYTIWLAEYRETPAYTGRYDMWQYTSSGEVDGIDGRVDLDLQPRKYDEN